MKHVNEWVFTFDGSEAEQLSAEILGNKGYGLVQMTGMGLPVPPGFIISTRACIAYLKDGQFPPGLWEELQVALKHIELKTGKCFGDETNPLLFSVRSGARVSLPGMMSTIKNIGLTAPILQNFFNSGAALFASSTCLTLLREYSDAVESINDTYTGINTQFEKYPNQAIEALNTLIPQDPWEQLKTAIESVFKSWNSQKLQKEREQRGYASDMGTACTVQMMVFGNRDQTSGSGVVHTRDPQTGAKVLNGDFALEAQGDAVVSGQRVISPENWREIEKLPGVLNDLDKHSRLLEKKYGWAQDIEFTVESNHLWLLQTRKANLDSEATIKTAVDMVNEGLIYSRREALKFAIPAIIGLSILQFDPDIIKNTKVITRGLDTVSGAASGILVVACMKSLAKDVKVAVAAQIEATCRNLHENGQNVVLVTDEMDTELVPALEYVNGILSKNGGKNCHLAIIARKKRIPTVVGCDSLEFEELKAIKVGNSRINAGDSISIDGSSGFVYAGLIKMAARSEVTPETITIHSWMNEYGYRFPWAVAAYTELSLDHQNEIQSSIPNNIEDLPWQTEKARVIDLIVKAFPPESRLGMTVIAATDNKQLLVELNRSIDAGFEPGVRSCFIKSPPFGKAPWEMGLTKELAKKFVGGDPAYIKERRCKIDGDWGTYPDWINSSPFITELVVMDNPPGLGLKDSNSRERHFVFNVQCNDAKNDVVVELLLNTDQLRDIERLEQPNAIYISMQLDQNKSYFKQPLRFKFGSHHGTDLTNQAPVEFWDYESAQYKSQLNSKSWRIAQSVSQTVFNSWWEPPYALPYRMMFLSQHGLDVLEVQGRCDLDGNIEYIRIYDCKGRDEEKQAMAASQNKKVSG